MGKITVFQDGENAGLQKHKLLFFLLYTRCKKKVILYQIEL
jgi:hypothetical protein